MRGGEVNGEEQAALICEPEGRCVVCRALTSQGSGELVDGGAGGGGLAKLLEGREGLHKVWDRGSW